MRLFITFITALPFLLSNAQGFRVRHYTPGASTNIANSIFETIPGNYITGGFIVDSATNGNMLCIMALGSQGQVVWRKKYGSTQFQYLYNPYISRAFYKQGNNIYYAGCAKDINNKQIGVLIKFNFNGDTLWQKIYKDPDPTVDVIPQMLTRSVDGGFLLTGFFQVNVATSYQECMLIKTDANGNELWRKKIGKVIPNVQDGKAIVQDSLTKKIVVVGYQYIGNANNWGAYDNVLILDSLGVKLNQLTYAGAGLGGVLLDLIQTKDKKMVAVGAAIYPQTVGGTNLEKSFIVKFDLNNPSSPIWRINDFDKLELNNALFCLVELPENALLVGGLIDTMQLNNLPTNCLTRLTKIDKNGTITWNRYYDYKINDSAQDNNQNIKSLNRCADGSWIAGIECDNFPGPNPFFFVKYDSTGCDSTLAYCRSLVNVGMKINKLPGTEINIFPNPTNGLLNISIDYAIEKTGLLLHITDLTGRHLKEFKINTEKQIIDLKDLTEGLYLITVTKNKEVVYQTRLMKQD